MTREVQIKTLSGGSILDDREIQGDPEHNVCGDEIRSLMRQLKIHSW